MPTAPPRQCDRCRRTFTGSRCPCRTPWEGSKRSGQSTRAYRRYRDQYMADHPLCEWPSCPELGAVADHVTPISEGGDMFGPLRTLCHAHHDAVTAEQARRGRRRKR